MSIALIFGVDGQDGSYLAELLLSKGYSVIGWSPIDVNIDFSNIDHLMDKIKFVRGDLTKQTELIQLIGDFHPDEVYNLAAPSSPAASWNSTVEVGNIAGLSVARILDALRLSTPEARFYQASTSELFGDPLEEPQSEKTPFNPRNPYGIAKLYGHWITVSYRRKYQMYLVSGILYNHESPRRGKHFVTRKISLGVAKIKLGLQKDIRLGNLDARRDWGFAGDYVLAIWKMLQADSADDYVIGTGKTHSVREFCRIAFDHVNLDYRDYVITDPEFFRPLESVQLVADNGKAKRKLGWQPKVQFSDLVKMMVDSDLEQLEASDSHDINA